VILKFKNTFKYISIALILVLLGSFQLAVPVSAVGETAVINPTSGAQGTVITINGTAWGANAVMTIQATPYDGWGGTAIMTTANSAGAFTTTLTVPATAQIGNYIINMSSHYGGYFSAPFAVVSGFNLVPNTGPAGSAVNVSGSGFTPGVSVPLLWDNSTLLATPVANSAGAISASVIIPVGVRGTHSISTIGGAHTASFFLSSKITLSAPSGGAGFVVGITGSGFGASTQVNIGGITGLAPFTAATNAAGTFTATFTVPSSSPRGEYTLTASDAGGSATAVFNVTQSIILTLPAGKTKVSPGDVIIISGQNLAPGLVTFKLDGVAAAGLYGAADSAGILANVNFTVPATRAGLHTLTAISSDLVEAPAQFTVQPAVTISTSNCAPASTVIASGAGFAAGAAITITLGSGPTLAMTTTDSNGSFGNTSVTIPASASGEFLLTARDAFSNSAGAFLTVQSTWAANLNPPSGAQDVPVNPTNFNWDDLAGATGYEFQIAVGNTIPAGAATVSLTQSAYSVPNLVNNTLYTWRVCAVTGTLAGEWATATFSTVAAAPATSTITVTSPPATITQTQTSTIVVTQPPQIVTLPPVTITVAPPPSAIISENTSQFQPGHVGMDINIAGTGFKPHSIISITFESIPVTVATANSDAGGSFLAAFEVPVLPAGIHVIKATDGTTTKEFPFMMDAGAPEQLTLREPVTRQPVSFSWSPSYDPSGVTYSFQLSQDPAFGFLVLEKSGLTTPDFKMTADQKLEGSKTYYWRVRAIDLAGNVGAWSATGSFELDFWGFVWDDWMMYTGIGVGAVVILLLGLVVGRRSSRDW
jgi:hypothetical protein